MILTQKFIDINLENIKKTCKMSSGIMLREVELGEKQIHGL